MLPLLLMLLSDPATPPTEVSAPDPEVRLRVTVTGCADGGFQRIDRSIGEAPELRPDLTYRPDGEVRHYLLLDRRVRGCPAPISYALPDRQGGFIRELGRTRPVTPAPNRVHPPRSSE